jgi:hypothetical protein
VSEQVSATYAILGEARRHFAKAMGGDVKQLEKETAERSATPSPSPSPHPKTPGHQLKAPVNGQK